MESLLSQKPIEMMGENAELLSLKRGKKKNRSVTS